MNEHRWSVDVLSIVVAIAIVWGANHFGWWVVTPIVGFVVGWMNVSSGRKAIIALLTGGLGWLLPLVWQSFQVSIGQAAATLSGVMGFGTSSGWIVWTLTGVFGILLCLTACWLGTAIRGLRVRPSGTYWM